MRSGVPIQLVSNLKNTQVKKKGKACLECVLASEDVTLKGMKNGQVMGRFPKYTRKDEGRRAELIISAAEWSDSGDCPAIAMQDSDPKEQYSSARVTVEVTHGTFDCSLLRTSSTTDICNYEEYVCDVHALTGDPAKLCVVLNDAKVEGIWLKDGKITAMKGIQTVKQGDIHLIIEKIEEHEGTVTAKTKRMASIKRTASIKVPFKAKPVPKVRCFNDDTEVTEEEKVVMEKASDYITIKTCAREDTGDIVLNLKNDSGSASDNILSSTLLGKVEFLEHMGKCQMRWKAPKGIGGKQVTHFLIERRMAGEKSVIKVGVVENNYTTFATEIVEEGKAYFRIHVINSECLIKPLETEESFAQEPINPPRQVSQPQVVDVRKEDVTITNFPAQDGGSPVQGLLPFFLFFCTGFKVDGFLEDTDEFCVIAANRAGPGLLNMPSASCCRGSCRLPRAIMYGLLKLVVFSNSTISLAWQEPDQGDVLSGYILEMAEDTKKWTKCTEVTICTTYTVGGLQERPYYFTRAVNAFGMGEAVEFDLTVRLKSHMVVRAGTAPCVHTSFPGSPPPPVMWQKKGISTRERTRSIPSSYPQHQQPDCGVLKCDGSTTVWFTAAEKVYSSKYTVTPSREQILLLSLQ
ncbi:LOW QUALITY PROTEIN: immunoglobulin superfamily member 22 [Pterocles gutturalis]